MGIAQRFLAERARRYAQPNQALMDALLHAMQEAVRLVNEGHTIESLEVVNCLPTIRLTPSTYLRQMVAEGRAGYSSHGIGPGGQRRRMGELLGRGPGCRVTWLEIGF